MGLVPGSRLGPYEILSAIGAGGMGEVYRARDASLGRDVAIKVLPDAFAQDAERLARFEREAKTLAALNHHNIAHVYGLEQADGVRALVMELVDGPTLADRIAHGAVPLDEALPIAMQIAQALEAAHEQGIIHRDLKPANVKVRPDGMVKVLDFGLAKALGPPEGGHSATPASSPMAMTHSPTLTSPVGVTSVGMILGTAAYMATEQAKGKPVSKATDIWAFGCVLYEMLTGRAVFAGDDVTEVLAAVVRAEPDWNALPASTPREIRTLLRHCLQKDHRKRWQDASSLRIAIEDALTAPIDAAVVAAPRRAGADGAAWAVAAIFAVVAVASGWLAWRSSQPADRPLVRLEVDLGADTPLGPVPNEDVVLSPDGKRLAWVSIVAPARRGQTPEGVRSRVFVRRLDQSTPIELPGTSGALGLFFSPDSQWLAFYAQGRFNKISVEGGAVVPLSSEQRLDVQSRAGVWREDGTILATNRNELWRIPASGGEPVKVADLRTAGYYEMAQLLPDGRNALAVSFSGRPGQLTRADSAVEVLSLADGTSRTLVRGGSSPRYVPSGHLLYVSGGTLFAAPFDVNALEMRGTAVPILDDVQFNAGNGRSALSFSRDGTLVYRKGGRYDGFLAFAARTRIEWIDAAGRRAPVSSRTGPYSRPRLSPDGSRLALLVTEPNDRNEWILDVRRDGMTKVTFGSLSVSTTAWSADGQYVFMGSGGSGIHWARADGSGEPQVLLTEAGSLPFVSSFSREANRLTYASGGDRSFGASTIFTVPLTEEGGRWKAGKPELFFESPVRNETPEFSPDGRWIAYTTNESGRNEVNVRPFPSPGGGQGAKSQISTDGGENPRWSRTGNELLYESANRIMSVRYTVNGDTFVADKPRVRVDKLESAGGWDLAPDGRIVALVPIEAAAPPPAPHTVIVLQNFFDELRRRVPID